LQSLGAAVQLCSEYPEFKEKKDFPTTDRSVEDSAAEGTSRPTADVPSGAFFMQLNSAINKLADSNRLP